MIIQPYTLKRSSETYEFGTIGQAGCAVGRFVAAVATMAQAGCGSQTHPAGKPTPALSNCLHRRGQAGVAGGKRYGGFAPENDIARACAAASGVERGDSGCGGQSRAEAAGATQSQQPAFEGAALESFDAAAAKLEDKHPELAAALAELVRKHSR